MAGLVPTDAQQTATGEFLRDLMPGLPSTKPVIIMDPDQHAVREWTGRQHFTTVIDAQREEAATIVDHLNGLIEAELLDLVFFLDPLPAKLISEVTKGLENISLRKVNVFIPHGEPHGLKLRLDTRLYMYKVEGEESVTLFESYYIRQAF